MTTTVTARPPRPLPRISKIAGRYLVFDHEDASILRREANTNGSLVGTLPQQPTQNMFLGLPIELRPEEAEALVHKNLARVVDDVAAHQAALRSPSDRTAYIQSLRRDKAAAHKVLAERAAQKAAVAAGKAGGRKKSKSKAEPAPAPAPAPPSDGDDTLFASAPPAVSSASSPRVADSPMDNFGVTPTSSRDLIPADVDREFEVSDTPEGPLARYLQDGGYHTTPGLRFGSEYSVYPGDPLRFHAHFMANQYDWDEEIPILDIIEGGRLATAVKKAFVIAGSDPSKGEAPANVTAYSIEWAGM
jgi:tRNA-splicing endonuclease subunit Sen34